MATTIDPIVDPRVTRRGPRRRRTSGASTPRPSTSSSRSASASRPTRALDIWEAHGATVDREYAGGPGARPAHRGRARGTPRPSTRSPPATPSQDLPLDGRHVYAGTDGCGVEVVDLRDGRASTLRAAGRGGHRPGRRCARRGRPSTGFPSRRRTRPRCRAASTSWPPSGGTPPSTSRPRASSPATRRGRRSRWRPRSPAGADAASATAGAVDHAVHHEPARPGRREPRRRAHRRGGRASRSAS